MTSIDRLDAEIIGRLTVNARIGIADLATDLGVSRATVQTRIRRLEETGVLVGFQPIIDLSAIGMPVQALVSLEIDQRMMPQVVAGLKDLPEVLEIKIQAGREDLLVHVAISSLEALQVLTASIVVIDGVRKTTSTFSVATPIPYRVQPLLDHITADAGWGRSTPAPAVDLPPGDRSARTSLSSSAGTVCATSGPLL
jgi:DNA-binding Lrp family transcriptional regulator